MRSRWTAALVRVEEKPTSHTERRPSRPDRVSALARCAHPYRSSGHLQGIRGPLPCADKPIEAGFEARRNKWSRPAAQCPVYQSSFPICSHRWCTLTGSDGRSKRIPAQIREYERSARTQNAGPISEFWEFGEGTHRDSQWGDPKG